MQKDNRFFIKLQRDEATSHIIYEKVAAKQKDLHNKDILLRMASEEKKHYGILKEYTNKDVKPYRFMLFIYKIIFAIFGLTFGIKLLEKGEDKAISEYSKLLEEYPDIESIITDEQQHEQYLIELINEERLKYIGSIVLGLNDALVELTGALAGFTFAIQNNKVIAIVGSITGISAALSMAASEYLSAKSEGEANPVKSSLYTGTSYIITVVLLVLPFVLLNVSIIALGISVSVALLIIALFNYYVSVTKDEHFWKRFGEMAIISLVITAISFGIGYVVNLLFPNISV